MRRSPHREIVVVICLLIFGSSPSFAGAKKPVGKAAAKSVFFSVVYRGKGTYHRESTETRSDWRSNNGPCDPTKFVENDDATFTWFLKWYVSVTPGVPGIGVFGDADASMLNGTATRSMSGPFARDGDDCSPVDGTCTESASPSVSGIDFGDLDAQLQIRLGSSGFAIRADADATGADLATSDSGCAQTVDGKGPHGWGDPGWPYYYSNLAADVSRFRNPLQTKTIIVPANELTKFGRQIFVVSSTDQEINDPVPGASFDCSGTSGPSTFTCRMGQEWSGTLRFDKITKIPTDRVRAPA